jgi:hypothetical protein
MVERSFLPVTETATRLRTLPLSRRGLIASISAAMIVPLAIVSEDTTAIRLAPSGELQHGLQTIRVPVPLGDNGAPINLVTTILRPPGNGPHPLLIFYHGSTGKGDNPALFGLRFLPRRTGESIRLQGLDGGRT